MVADFHRKTHGVGLDLRVSLDFLIQREDTAFSSKSKAVTNKHGLRYLHVFNFWCGQHPLLCRPHHPVTERLRTGQQFL